MRQKLIAVALPILCLAACATAPTSAGAVTVGISDNSPAMFGNSFFGSLHLRQARLLVAWNAAVMKDHTAMHEAAAWISAARAAGVSPLIDFEADPGNAGNVIPSVRQYSQAVSAFIRAFPTVRQYIPWNEPDFNFRKLSREPALAAGYFNALVSACRGCTVIAGDVYLDAQHLGAWITAYRKALRSKPAAWALHPYNDVTYHTTSQIRVMMKDTSGPLWLTEISGVVHRGHWHGHTLTQTLAKQAQDESFLFSLAKRFPRIARIYHYQWQSNPAAPWDSGLLGADGTPRPAYYVLAKAARGH